MKLKLDYVTNSSSTSFIVWGSSIKVSDIADRLGDKLFEKYKRDHEYQPHEKELTKKSFLESYEFSEYLEMYMSDICPDLDFYGFGIWDDLSWYSIKIGQSPILMKDDQTLIEFKTQIAEKILKVGFFVLPEDIKFIEINDE